MADELDDAELAEMASELADNVSFIIVEDTDERPSRMNIQTIHDYIIDAEELSKEYNDDEY